MVRKYKLALVRPLFAIVDFIFVLERSEGNSYRFQLGLRRSIV